MPVDMPPNYAYVADSMTQEQVQTVETRNDNGFIKGSEIIFYSSSLPHLTETLLDHVHNDLDYIKDVSYQNAMLPYQKDIQEKLPNVSKKMDSLNYRDAYQELVKESKKNADAKDVLFEVDNEILTAMPDFYGTIDVIKDQEQTLATERLKKEGILFDKNPVVESIARVGSQQDFDVQPAIDVKTFEDEITRHNNEEEVTLYRLPGDSGSMLRATVGRDANHEQHYALCRASELTTMYEYNKYAHDLIENTPAAKDFFLAQATMESIALGGNQYGLETSKMIDDAMLQTSPTYAQYGHVSTNPLHRVEETVSALSKVLEDNKKDHQFAKASFNFEMNNSGLGEQLARDVKSAPNYYTKLTRTDEKKLVEQLKKRLDPQVGPIMYNKAIQATAHQKEAAAR